MSKKASIFVAVFLVLLLFTNINAFAGDTPEGLMLGEQKALFIGKITAVDTDSFVIAPSTVLMGSIHESEIKIKKFEHYYGTSIKPQTGDFIVAVLNDDDEIDDSWVFKSTSDDYKNLKLVSEQYELVIRYEKYINDGEYLEAQRRLDDKAKKSSSSINAGLKNSQSKEGKNKVNPYISNYIIVSLLLVASVILVRVAIFKKRHDNQR